MKLGLLTTALALACAACGGTAFSILDVPVPTDGGGDAYHEGAPHGDDIGDTGFLDAPLQGDAGDAKAADDADAGGEGTDAADGNVIVDAADAGVDTGACVADGTYNCSYGSTTTTFNAKVEYCAISLQGTGTPFGTPTPPSCQTCGGYTCACVMASSTPCTMGVYGCMDTSSGPVLLCN
jgi:hypothetical protein